MIPVVERNQARFQHLDTWVPRTDGLPWLLIGVGILVVLWGAWFLRRSLIGRIRLGESLLGWFMVTGVGLIVIGVVVFMRLLPSLDGGQKMVKDLRPVFATERIQADTPAISMVSTVVDLLDPITTDAGGAAADGPLLPACLPACRRSRPGGRQAATGAMVASRGTSSSNRNGCDRW